MADRGAANFSKSQRGVKGVRGQVWRILIDLAYDDLVARPSGLIEQAGVEARPRMARATTTRST